MRRTLFKTLLVAVSAAALATGAYAFHDGGVAECTGCHSMHSAASPMYLLVGSDTSSTCLSCHENPAAGSYHISTPAAYFTANPLDGPLNKTPGGDFGWLRLDRTATASYGRVLNFYGEDQGHNIIAADYGYVVDSGNPTAPGGTMPSGLLKCTSCHDKHGQGRIVGDPTNPTIQTPVVGGTYDPIFGSGSYGTEYPAPGEAVGTYRLLPGSYYTAWDSVNFPGVPVAIVPSSYNRSEAPTTTRTSYGFSPTDASGFTSWGHWCATCHPDMHTDTMGGLVHRVDDNLPSGIVTNYNNYVMTGDLTGVFPRGGPFTSLVPFASNTKDMTALAALALTDDSDLSGPDVTSHILCLTCHRAHASAWEYSLRWNGGSEFLTLGGAGNPVYPGVDTYPTNAGQFNNGYTEEQMTDGYYGRAANREFSAHQRSLCNKCHVKD